MQNTLEDLARQLDASDEFRVLRRLKVGAHFSTQPDSGTFRAAFLDLETTGLNPDVDEIIEIGIVPFTYGSEGQIHTIEKPYSKLREPSQPIPEETTKVNNITNEMVKGKTIDPSEVFDFVRNVGLIIAHNAGFDRPFLEKFSPEFRTKPWACSMEQIPWKEEGFDGTGLSYISYEYGFFFDAHRAVEDCLAGIEVLSRKLPSSGLRAMARLLESARQHKFRIWAVGAPYDLKDTLKSRGYRWSNGDDGRYKSWYLDVEPEHYEDEITFLSAHIFNAKIDLPVSQITAKDRFSGRV